MTKKQMLIGFGGGVALLMILTAIFSGGQPPPQQPRQPQAAAVPAVEDEEPIQIPAVEDVIIATDDIGDRRRSSFQEEGRSLGVFASVPPNIDIDASLPTPPPVSLASDPVSEQPAAADLVVTLQARLDELQAELDRRARECEERAGSVRASKPAVAKAARPSPPPPPMLIPGAVSVDGDTVVTGLRWTGRTPSLDVVQEGPRRVSILATGYRLGAPLPDSPFLAGVSSTVEGGVLRITYDLEVDVRPTQHWVADSVIINFVPLYRLPIEEPWKVVAITERAAVLHHRDDGRVVAVVPGSRYGDLGLVRAVDPGAGKVMTDVGYVSE